MISHQQVHCSDIVMGNEIGNKIIDNLPLNIDALGVHTIMSSHDNEHIHTIFICTY